jgi:trimeric autotransporter adhesin
LNKHNRLISLALSSALAFSLVGCSDDETTASDATVASQEETKTVLAEILDEVETPAKLEKENVTIRTSTESEATNTTNTTNTTGTDTTNTTNTTNTTGTDTTNTTNTTNTTGTDTTNTTNTTGTDTTNTTNTTGTDTTNTTNTTNTTGTDTTNTTNTTGTDTTNTTNTTNTTGTDTTNTTNTTNTTGTDTTNTTNTTNTTGTDTTTNTTADNEFTRVSNPTGKVVGLVQNTNGMPIVGATVYLAGQNTTTDEGGNYLFSDIPVTAVSGANETGHNPLSITISASSDYVGATVTVTPKAQIDGGADKSEETFIDGFMAQAGTAVLPSLNATVTGRLEYKSSEASIANQAISLDFVSVNSIGANVAQTQNGVQTTYATTNYTTTTDADGFFTLSNLPNDTVLTYIVPNYVVDGEENQQGAATTTVTTNDETSLINIGDLQVSKIENTDDVSPIVVGVDGLIQKGFEVAAPAMFDDDVKGDVKNFVVRFSEPLNTDLIDSNSVIVKTGLSRSNMQDESVTVTASSDKKSLTLATTADLAEGTLIDINFLRADFQDTNGNSLALNSIDVANTEDLQYDSYGVNNASTKVVTLQLQIFKELNTDAQTITVRSQLTLDETGSDDNDLVQAKSIAFNDVLDGEAGFQQLNANDDDDTANGSDAAERLSALATALGAGVVKTDAARINFTPTSAASYTVKVTSSTGAAKAQANVFSGGIADGNKVTNANYVSDFTQSSNDNIMTITTDDNSVVEIYLSNVVAGDIVTLTPLDDLGYPGIAQTIPLADNVAPTTILQNSYDASGAATTRHNGASTVVQYGDGGELSQNSGTLTIGTPYLALNASLLDNKTAAGDTVSKYRYR